MRYETDTGGAGGRFRTTIWTQIRSACTEDGSRGASAAAEILRGYWKPVYCYLRRKGIPNEPAKDLTQEFFCEVVLARGLIARADASLGRFRTFLLTALDNFVRDQSRKDRAAKRRPDRPVAELDAMLDAGVALPDEQTGPQEAFEHAWAAGLLETVLLETEASCRADDLAAHWEVFVRSILRPILQGDPRPSREQLGADLGVADAKTVSNMLVTAIRRFRKVLRRHVRELVTRDDEVDDEIVALMDSLSAGAGR